MKNLLFLTILFSFFSCNLIKDGCSNFYVTKDIIGTTWVSGKDTLKFSKNVSLDPEPKFYIEHILTQKGQIHWYEVNKAWRFREIGPLIEIYPALDSIEYTNSIDSNRYKIYGDGKGTGKIYLECKEENGLLVVSFIGGVDASTRGKYIKLNQK